MNAKKSITCIGPVNQGEKRPLFSVMIPTYNCAQYLRVTLESVLSQDLGPDEMQIEVIDDGSTLDDPESVVNEIGKGRVGFFRNSINLGATQNFNNCLKRSKGKYVHILHGDDYVGPGFYLAINQLIQQEPTYGLFGTRTFVMDAEGLLNFISPKFPQLKVINKTTNLFLDHCDINILYFPGMVINRKCVESTGGFDESFGHVADWDMWIRLMYYHGAILSNIPLAYYRMFDLNDSARHIRLGNNVIEILRAYQGFQTILPNLDNAIFHKKMQEIAYFQYNRFLCNKDACAALANYEVWKKLTPLKKRILEHFKFYLKAIGRQLM